MTRTAGIYLEVDDRLCGVGRQRDGGDAADEVTQVLSCLELRVTGNRPQQPVDQRARDVALQLVLL